MSPVTSHIVLRPAAALATSHDLREDALRQFQPNISLLEISLHISYENVIASSSNRLPRVNAKSLDVRQKSCFDIHHLR